MLVLEQYRVHGLGSLLVHGRRHMAVKVDGCADTGVAQHLGDQLGVHAVAQQERSSVCRRS